MMKKFSLLLFLLFSYFATAQTVEHPYSINKQSPNWIQLMYSPNVDVGKVITAYEVYYQKHELVKNAHTQYYKRWIRKMSRDFRGIDYGANPAVVAKQEQQYQAQSLKLRAKKGSNAQWQGIGPFDFDKEAQSRSYAAGAAHVYTVEQSISNPNVLYAGTATAGVWKSQDKGESWFLLTQHLLLEGVLALEIDPTNDQIVYFESGGMLYKTTNSGGTWQVIGDAAFQNTPHRVTDMVLHPTNNQQLFIASDQGLYRTDNGGATFTQVVSGLFQEIEFHPTNNNIIYAVRQLNEVSTTFYKSTNGGTSFQAKTNNGWPTVSGSASQARTEIAVTPANPNIVYALASGEANGGSGLYGVYRSDDAGETWTRNCCGPQVAGVPSPTNQNLMAWSDDGTDDGGQYYYDLALAVSPIDADHVFVAGVNLWISTDGGQSFNCPSKWSHSEKPNYVHADIHDIRFYGNDLWVACDGGIFYSNDLGTTFPRKMYGIQGTDFWGFGAGFWDGEVLVGGTYHNGTLLKDNNTYVNGWVSTDGGDNYRGFTNFGKDRVVFTDYNKKFLNGNRLADIPAVSYDPKPNASYIIGLSSELVYDPRCYNIVYSGVDHRLMKSTDDAATFTEIHPFNGTVTAIEVAWSNPEVLYVVTWDDFWAENKKIWRSRDGGKTWTNITPLTNNSWIAYDITVSSNNADELWAARTPQTTGDPTDGNKVYYSNDGGDSWTNITTSALNGEYPTNIVHQRGTNGGVYLGTRRAVYYRNKEMNDWALFNNNLPLHTQSIQLIPYYRGGKLRNGTNRSVYEADFYENTPPSAQIAANRFTANCLDNTIHFVDHSAVHGDQVGWSWHFEGGIPSTSTLRNPIVSYDVAGKYDVMLTVTDQYGSSTQTYTDFIEFLSITETLPASEDFEELPNTWTPESSNGGLFWGMQTVNNEVNCTHDQVIWVNNFDHNTPGAEAYLTTITYDLTQQTNINLTYDYAYARYGAGYEDGFALQISTDCGMNWTGIYEAHGTDLTTVADQGEAWTPSNCSDWQTQTIDLNDYANQHIRLRFVGINGWGNNLYLDNIQLNGEKVTVAPPVRFHAQIWLEAAYEETTQSMKTDLQNNNWLPLTQPYNERPWNYSGTESLLTMPMDVVDWVLVELRTADANTIVAQSAALLRNDGVLLGVDGMEGVPFFGLTEQLSYRLLIRHRHHIDVLSAIAIAPNNIDIYSFGNPTNVLGGTKQLSLLSNNIHALKGGDFSGNGIVSVEDFNAYLMETGASNAYFRMDVNMDGSVTVDDFNWYRVRASAIGVGLVRY